MPNLFQQLTAFPNLHRAYLDARYSKRYRRSILRFGTSRERRLIALQRELESATYRHGQYREFVIIDSKKRTIKAAPFRDRVVHHALCNVIEPILDRCFIYDSFACRAGKGTHQAVRRLEQFIRSLRGAHSASGRDGARIYCLKGDVWKYFDSINHRILIEILERKIRDRRVLQVIREIVASHPAGIPIGNLTSQLFANVYLNELDHYVKRTLRTRYYLRYMDDFVVLCADKQQLAWTRERIRTFLRERLALVLHPKKAEIFPIDGGVDFLGYVIVGKRRLLRKSTVRRFVKKRRRRLQSVIAGRLAPDTIAALEASWRGYAKFADAYRLVQRLRLKSVHHKGKGQELFLA